MYLMRKWNEIMGPKDERLEAEENKAMRAAASILLIGCVISLYYAIMLNQVASTTNNPIATALGERLVPVQFPLIVTILAAGFTSIAIQLKSGSLSSHTRFAEINSIPWNFIALFSVACGVVIGVLTCGLRIIAEIQIVGVDQVAWAGDIAMGVVFFGIGFVSSFAALTLTIRDSIKRRRRMEAELEG